MSLVEVGLRGEADVLARHGEATEGFAVSMKFTPSSRVRVMIASVSSTRTIH